MAKEKSVFVCTKLHTRININGSAIDLVCSSDSKKQGIIGFLPVFKSKAAVLKWTKGSQDFMEMSKVDPKP